MLKDWLVVNEVVDGALVLVRCKPAAGRFKCNIDRPFARVEVELALDSVHSRQVIGAFCVGKN
jgi:hypothetical protein